MFAKSDKYFCDKEAVLEQGSKNAHGGGNPGNHRYSAQSGRNDGGSISKGIPAVERSGRNPRNVWTINTSSFSGSHFAVFPEDLVQLCIKASTSEKVCGICGAPYVPVIEKNGKSTYEKVKDKSWRQMNEKARGKGIVPSRPNSGQTRLPNGTQSHLDSTDKSVIEYAPVCEHEDDSGKCRVLDPFLGRGTTAFVARKLGREGVGCELSGEYVKIAEDWIAKRLKEDKVFENEKLEKIFS